MATSLYGTKPDFAKGLSSNVETNVLFNQSLLECPLTCLATPSKKSS